MSRLRDIKREERAGRPTKSQISVERLHELLEYDPETGELFWKRRPAGTVNSQGYSQVSVDGKIIGSHRIAFAMMTGKYPEHEVDHKNRSRSDNRWCNLAEATRSQNGKNTGTPSTNTSGFRGVSWHKGTGKWHARIISDGVQYHLGYFDELADAATAYGEARLKFHGVSS